MTTNNPHMGSITQGWLDQLERNVTHDWRLVQEDWILRLLPIARAALAMDTWLESTAPDLSVQEFADLLDNLHKALQGTQTVQPAQDQPKKVYVPWAMAGGPNECQHGYAKGIPCPDCDRMAQDQAGDKGDD